MRKILLSLSLLIAFVGCEPNDRTEIDAAQGQVSDTEFAQNFGSATQHDFIGQVVDVNQQPIVGATVKVGSATIQTDVNGVFIVNMLTYMKSSLTSPYPKTDTSTVRVPWSQPLEKTTLKS